MLGTLAVQFHASPAEIGRLPTLTQLGYAIGILLLSPIGDRFDRRWVIIVKMVFLGLALLAVAAARSLLQLCAWSLALTLAGWRGLSLLAATWSGAALVVRIWPAKWRYVPMAKTV